MEDRYLCKAKRTDNDEWVIGGLVRYGFTGREKYYIVPSYASDLYALKIDPSTICWCTGLKDKNGKLIFENESNLNSQRIRLDRKEPARYNNFYR